MAKVCKKCPLWKMVRGRDVNTGHQVDQWDCAISWLPMLMIETSAQARSATAATESFRNEMVSANLAFMNVAASARNEVRQKIDALEEARPTLLLKAEKPQ